MGEIKTGQAGDLRPGSYVIFDGVACVVKNVQKSKTGKHGSAKCRIEAIGIINNDKKIHLCPAGDNVEIPIIEKKSAQVLSVQDNTATVMDNESYETMDLEVPTELKGQIKEGDQVSYWLILDKKVIQQKK